ncbi:MAG TPA: PKD domain-containing protein, partial [Flavobacteriales bacterium]|nr:PKD domain-containing protein [Flavobacteriales bacterium]
MNLLAAVYNPIVSDGNGCFFTMPVIVSDLTGPSIDSVVWTDVTCAGDSNGSASITATGISPPLTYIWKSGTDTVGINITAIFNLWGGTYTITVIDSNGCIAGASVTVAEPATVASAIINSNGTSCFGVCDGSASVMAGGGTTPYAYLWSNSQVTPTATGLCAGLHNVVVTDVNGCSTSSPVSILEPQPLTVTDSINDASCNGGSDGSIYLSVFGGTPFYSYGWLPNVAAGPIATNLSAQTYVVTVTDLNGCNSINPIAINEPTPLSAIGIGYPSVCGDYNGMAIVTPSGGVPPYTFLWDDPSATTTDTVAGLLARDPYYVVITDANGCILNYQVTVGDLPGPEVDGVVTVDILCNGLNTGTATVQASEGTPPLTYEWNDPAEQSGITATNLYAGPIVIVLTDANGCTVTGYANIDEPDTLVLFVSEDISICYGQSVDINATAGGGVPPYDYIWDNGLDSSQIQSVAPLTTTTYSLNVLDANSCPSSFDSVIVSVSPPLVPVPQNDSICVGADAVVGVSVTGGNGSPISYLWSNWATDSVQTLNGLIADTTLTVTVSDGCSPDSTVTVEIWVSPNPDVSFTVSGSGCEPYVLTAEVGSVGTVPPVNIVYWLWDFGDGSTSNDADSTTHVYVTADTFDVSLQVISDEGCTTTVVQQGAVVAYAAPTADFTIEQDEI